MIPCNRNTQFVFLIVLMVLALMSCDDQDPVAEALLYGNTGRPPVEIDLAMTRIDAWYLANGTFLYGFDVRFHNPNNDTIWDVYANIRNITPLGDVAEISYDDDQLYIPFIAPSKFEYPDFYWCFDCGTIYEIYIGNFWIALEPYVSGGQVFEITFDVEFLLGDKGYGFGILQSFTTVYDYRKNGLESTICGNISN